MILELIILGVIGVIYVTGDSERKAKMRTIGKGIIDVTKEVVIDVCKITKSFMNKLKTKKESAKNLDVTKDNPWLDLLRKKIIIFFYLFSVFHQLID